MATPASSPTTITRVAAPLRQELMTQLRTAIAAGEFTAGERLVERVLCERYGVSRTVVREVLRGLESEGLVMMVANRGPVVATLSDDDAIALFQVRGVIEALAAELFAHNASPDERTALLASCDAVADAYDSDRHDAWLHAKDTYYDALVTGSHNEVVRTTLMGLHARTQLLRGASLNAPGRRPQSLAEIREVAQLAAAGEAAKAFTAARRHVDAAAASAGHRLPTATDDLT